MSSIQLLTMENTNDSVNDFIFRHKKIHINTVLKTGLNKLYHKCKNLMHKYRYKSKFKQALRDKLIFNNMLSYNFTSNYAMCMQKKTL